MRNRIMNVQQIEFVKLSHFRHPSRECEIVWRIVKQRITGDLDLVIMNVRLRFGQTDRLRIRNKVNVVPALGQFESQLRGYNSTATIGWIACDSDLHAAEPLRSLCHSSKAIQKVDQHP